jgi:holo-[acyl-carrier protein] synthase
MDLAGLGVDIVEIDRIRRALDSSPRFKMRVFTERERDYCDRKARPEVHYALRFAAKEAVLKAFGTGFGHGVNVTDVEVVNNEEGKPEVELHGGAQRLADQLGIVELHLSLSFTHDVGVANAVAVKEGSRPRNDERRDPQAELAAAFKEARSIIDEIGDGTLGSSSPRKAPVTTGEQLRLDDMGDRGTRDASADDASSSGGSKT